MKIACYFTRIAWNQNYLWVNIHPALSLYTIGSHEIINNNHSLIIKKTICFFSQWFINLVAFHVNSSCVCISAHETACASSFALWNLHFISLPLPSTTYKITVSFFVYFACSRAITLSYDKVVPITVWNREISTLDYAKNSRLLRI